MERFWDKVNKDGECWEWIAGSRGRGYGAFKYKGKIHDAHRFSWYLTYGKWPSMWVLHKCDNRKCVKPEHLFEGTAKDNFQDAVSKGRMPQSFHWPKFYGKIMQSPNSLLTFQQAEEI